MKEYDYSSDGAYFVTICTFKRKSNITEPVKKVLRHELNLLIKRFSGIEIDYNVFMPNHCHIIFVLKKSRTTLPKVIQAFKSITTLKIKKSGFEEEYFWQKNYYEHVIRNEEELNRIREYVINNSEKERIDLEDIEK